jgi:hypothetical protein
VKKKEKKRKRRAGAADLADASSAPTAAEVPPTKRAKSEAEPVAMGAGAPTTPPLLVRVDPYSSRFLPPAFASGFAEASVL